MTGKQIAESLILGLLEKFPAKNFALSVVKDITSGPLKRGSRAGIPLLRPPFAICQKSHEPRFW